VQQPTLKRGLALFLLVLWIPGAPFRSEPNAEAQEVEELVVLGVRTGRLDPDVSAFRDVLRTDDFAGEHQDLADLLARRPGVFVRRFGGAGDPSEVSIRGSSSSQVVVTLNGVRANSALTGGVNLTRLCVPLIEEVGITRGVGGAREGSGAIGGTVDIITRSAGSEPETRVSFAGGDFETFEGSVFGSGNLGDLGLSLGYCGLDTEGDFQFARPEFRGPDGIPASFTPQQTQRINNQRTQHGGSLGLGNSLGPGRIELLDYWSYAEGGSPGIDCCTGVLAGQNPLASSEDWSNLAQLRWSGSPDNLLGDELEVMLYNRHEESRFRDPIQLSGGRIDSLTRLSTLGLRVDDRWALPLLGNTHDLSFAFDASQDFLRSTRQTGRTRPQAAGAVGAELRWLEGRVRVSPALRADWADGFDLQWVPTLGIILSPLEWLRVRANGGRSYRFPNFDELYLPPQGSLVGNPDLSPEDAWQFDVGPELSLDALGPFSNIFLSARYFRREIQELILWVRVNATTIQPRNTGDATSEGVELALDFDLTRFLHVGASHTELESTRDLTDKRLPGQPDRETSVRVRLGPEDIVKLVGEYQHTGDILVSEGGGSRLPSRDIWNASISLNIAALTPFDVPLESLWIYFAIDNIEDEAVRDTLSFPRPGRHASAGFEAHW
jgi:outer membrane cobalamin receptor